MDARNIKYLIHNLIAVSDLATLEKVNYSTLISLSRDNFPNSLFGSLRRKGK